MHEGSIDIGLIGLAVMGQNLVLNMNDRGFSVSVFNRTGSVTDAFLAGPARGRSIEGHHDLAALVRSLRRPRRVLVLVQAGGPVDAVLERLETLLDPGDVVVDLGNSHFEDTERRARSLRERGLLFVGSGVSGGEEGARHGPSIMPGGDANAWPHVREVFQAIAAKVDGSPCCDWIGPGGAGHYVKMIHNGIEYGDMQLIAETYQLMHEGLGMDHRELHDVFARWNTGPLDSYLVEITAAIMAYRDEAGEVVLEQILDRAGQKGTGKWTGISALSLGVPVTLIAEAVFARCLSSLKDERERAASMLSGPNRRIETPKQAFVDDLESALYAAKIVSYAQGYMLLRAAAADQGWELDGGSIALMWRGGCIIRSAFLGKIKQAFDHDPGLDNLMLAPFFRDALTRAQDGWRNVVAQAVACGVPTPALSSGLAFYDGYRRGRGSANLIQAQRDFFGAHTYERIDRPRGRFFHTNWTGTGGDVSSRSYEA